MEDVDPQIIDAIKDSIGKEQGAQEFYQKASDMVSQKALKDFFLELKQDEKGHEMLLTRMLNDIQDGKIVTGRLSDVSDDSLGDYGISRFLTKKNIEPESGYQDALIVAMKREEAASRGYQMLSKRTGNSEMKDLFLLLAQVEAGHLRRLEDLYEKEFLKDN